MTARDAHALAFRILGLLGIWLAVVLFLDALMLWTQEPDFPSHAPHLAVRGGILLAASLALLFCANWLAERFTSSAAPGGGGHAGTDSLADKFALGIGLTGLVLMAISLPDLLACLAYAFRSLLGPPNLPPNAMVQHHGYRALNEAAGLILGGALFLRSRQLAHYWVERQVRAPEEAQEG